MYINIFKKPDSTTDMKIHYIKQLLLMKVIYG